MEAGPRLLRVGTRRAVANDRIGHSKGHCHTLDPHGLLLLDELGELVRPAIESLRRQLAQRNPAACSSMCAVRSAFAGLSS